MYSSRHFSVNQLDKEQMQKRIYLKNYKSATVIEFPINELLAGMTERGLQVSNVGMGAAVV